MGLCLPGAAEPRALVERRRPRYEQLKDALREGILSGRYAVGARLPPVRRLREEYGVSFPTAHRAMRELAAEGLVEAGPGSKGTTVVRNEPPVRKRAITIACLLRPHRPRNEEDNFAVDMIQGIRDGVSAHGYRFVYHCLDEVDYDRRMRDLAQEEWVCGVLLDQRVPLGTIEALAASGLPAVLINRREAIAGLSSVAPDYERMGREGVRMLARKGYRRVAFAALYDDMATDGAPCGEQYPLRALARGFSAAAGAHGFPAQTPGVDAGSLWLAAAQAGGVETAGIHTGHGPAGSGVASGFSHDGPGSRQGRWADRVL